MMKDFNARIENSLITTFAEKNEITMNTFFNYKFQQKNTFENTRT